MRIRKIELIGFKSFKDKTVIHFDAGITGVVGPNGCGKSNIVDALLWVMGEMSAKDLRGSTMTDVIFAGSEDYAPSGLAEVSLTLENDGGPFPAAYMKHSEIMVTRRLHRNGESEYAINKEPARLRDIQEIFMDTGAGSKGFSIIQQGMIGKIIQSKPEERRTLIEEAAGITKFKARKRESQRKLEATDQNLVRLQDIIGELKRQIDSLQRQAQRAERYRNLKSQVEELELWISSLQYQELRDLAQKAQVTFQEAQNLEVVGSQEMASLEAATEQLRFKILEFEKNIENLQSEVFQKQSDAQKQELEIQTLKFSIEQARNQREMNAGLSKEQAARLELLKRDLESLLANKASIENDAQRFEQEFQQCREGFEAAETRIQELDQELTLVRRDSIALGQNESSLSGQLNVLRSSSEDLIHREQNEKMVLNELQQKHVQFEGRKKKLRVDLDQERQMQLELMTDAEAVEANKKILSQNIHDKKIEVDSFKDSLNQVASRLYGLENLMANFEGFSEGVRNVMLWQKAKAQEIHADGSVSFRPVSEVVEVEPGYEVALEAALGSRLQMLISEDAGQSLEAIDYLKEKKLGRSSFLSEVAVEESVENFSGDGVLGRLRDRIRVPEKYEKAAQALIGPVLLVDSLRTALRLRAEKSGWSFVTLDGDLLGADGVISGGAPESADSGVLKRKSEIKELIQSKEEWSGKLALAQAQLKKMEEQLATVTTDFENAQAKKINQEIKVTELRKDLERAETEFENSSAILARQEKECSRLSTQLSEMQEKIHNLEKHVADLRAQKAAKDERAEQLLQEYESEKLGFDQFQARVTETQVRSAAKKQELQGVLNQEQFLSRNVDDLEQQLNRIHGESEKNALVIDEGHLKVERAKLDFDRLLSSLEEAKTRLSAERNHFELESAELRNFEKKLSEAQRVRNENSAKMNEAQLKFEQAKLKEQYLLDQMRERYMLDLSLIYQEKIQRPGDRSEGERELAELKDKVAKIGDVNLSAIQEFEETRQRYEFLVQQQTDLNEAKDQLRKVIDRINKVCSKRFKETFDMVNERFQKVFPVLFGGGEARLELVEDPDKSDVGIDIIAKPPGKKMQNISLLSGGEKALTAVSLVFSIFLVKPSPYCLLDEVDAPLDDANVFRFNDLVREMAKRSQIIVVTHNKHTMEVAAKLYGVTMQERGVSTMVSVNLSA